MTNHPISGPSRALPGQPEGWGAQVVGLLSRQRDLYRELDRLSRAQGEMVSAEDADGLLRLLGAREQVMEGVLEVNAALEPFRARWAEVLDHLDGTQRSAVGGFVGELETLTRQIAERDEGDRRAMEARREAISVELGSLGRQQAAARAYGRGPGVASRYQDREV